MAAAGIQYVSPVEDFPEDKWDDIIAVCLNSAFHATKAALPYMLQQGWGRIVNTGSMHALVASPYKSAYNAAKHGIAGFTKTVALEMAQRNITCNAICPGYVLTGKGGDEGGDGTQHHHHCTSSCCCAGKHCYQQAFAARIFCSTS